MKKNFIFLAKSWKLSNRCVAGIEVSIAENKIDVIRKNKEPKWIRPVSNTDHGEVPEAEVKNIALGDIVEIDIDKSKSTKFQTENFLYKSGSIQLLRKAKKHDISYNSLISNENDLFGNDKPFVNEDEVSNLSHSLLFIKPEIIDFYFKENAIGKRQLKVKFIYKGQKYYLPITDTEFFDNYCKDHTIISDLSNVYFTISLAGETFGGLYYKLVAGVIY